MDLQLAQKLQQVGTMFKLTNPFFTYTELTIGNVNRTFKADYIISENGMAKVKSYLMQRVNTYAFRDPVGLMENIDRVTRFYHEKEPNKPYLHFHHTEDGKTYIRDGEDYWRVCSYIESDTINTTSDIEVVRSAAEAFGDFQMVLNDFDVNTLIYTIPDFHNTRKRYEKLRLDAADNRLGRLKNVRAEYDWLMSVMDKACALTDMQLAGELPLRVTHNDTKINNVLFDKQTHKALAVIDLDTVMPGLVAHDFGDAIRFAANFTEEDADDTTRTGVDLNIFWAFADGFLSKTASVLTENELESLPVSGFCLACELATRFLDDYLNGDKYFAVKKDNHNIIRTRCQIALAKDMLKKEDALRAIVRGCAEKYRA